MSDEREERKKLAEEAIDNKNAAADTEPGLDHPDRQGSGGDVGSSRPADELSQQSVEEAARENARPLDAETGVDDVRDPSTEEADSED